MKRSRYTDSQILSILKQNESGTSVAELCREHAMSDATFYKWRSKYAGITAGGMQKNDLPHCCQLVLIYSTSSAYSILIISFL